MGDDDNEMVVDFTAELAELIEASRDDIEEVEIAESGDAFTVVLETGELIRVSVKAIDEGDE